MGQNIEGRILGYLLNHPSARDTSEGIQVWWLPPDMQPSLHEVEGALQQLVARGWMNVRGEKGFQTFGLEASQLQMIEGYLKDREQHG